MTVLTELRDELQGFLTEAGIHGSEFIPEVVNPPVAIIAPDEPWVQELFDAKTFNHNYKVNMVVRLVAAKADNEEASYELDALVEAALLALAGRWESEVAQPFAYQVGNEQFLAADLKISTSITIA